MMHARSGASFRAGTLLIGALALSGCGGGGQSPYNPTPTSYSVSASVSGLASGASVVLQNNGADNLTVSANGTDPFSASPESGSAYAVTILTQPAGQTCTVAGGSGTVTDANIDVSITCAGIPYTVGITVMGLKSVTGLVLQDNGSDDLSVSSSGTYSFTTPVDNGSPYAVTISQQPTGASCFVTSGTGTVSGANANVMVTCPWHVAYFAYPQSAVPSDALTMAYLDQATGALFGPSATTISITDLQTVTVDPAGKFLFVGTGENSTAPETGSVAVYAIDPATGDLTAVGSPYQTGYTPAIAVDPTGKFLYAANNTTIAAFTIGASGALTPITESSAPGAAQFIAVDPSGKFVYATDYNGPGTGTLSGYTIDGTTGALTAIAGASETPDSPMNMTFAPDGMPNNGQIMYVPNQYAADFSGYDIDPTTGALTAAGPFLTGAHPVFALVDATGQYLYIDNGNTYGYSLQHSFMGAPGDPYQYGGVSLTIDPSDNVLYVTGVGYAVDPTTGALGPASNPAGIIVAGYNIMAIAALH